MYYSEPGEPIVVPPFIVETRYESLGNYSKTIPRYIQKTQEILEKDEMTVPQENSFYLNSSDSLDALMSESFSGKRVMTVSGSGEFAHIFIYGGATEICSFDISPAAAFNSELRHKALCTLSMDDYIKLFCPWMALSGSFKEGSELYDQDCYEKVRDHLSEPAKVYFDLIVRSSKIRYAPDRNWNGFARARYNKKHKTNRLIGDIIKDEEEYKALQEKAKKVKFTQVICDATDMVELTRSFSPDCMYLSNVGYYPGKTFPLAQKYVDVGVGAVYCTVSKNDDHFIDTHGEHGYDMDNYFFNGQMLKRGSRFMFETYAYRDDEGVSAVVETVGMDRAADYGLLFKVVKK